MMDDSDIELLKGVFASLLMAGIVIYLFLGVLV